MSEKNHYVAVAQIEQNVDGERKYVEPGSPIYLTEADAKPLLKLTAIRTPTKDEAELEQLRAASSKGRGRKKADENPEI